jgi:BolA family transcriptional regulator, general stress-responsive regulator
LRRHGKALLCHLDDGHMRADLQGVNYQQRITEKLTAAFSPASLDVIDESEQHHGHGGWRDGGETHFRIRISSSAFLGKSRVDMHRMINALLQAELAERVHALAIEAKAE